MSNQDSLTTAMSAKLTIRSEVFKISDLEIDRVNEEIRFTVGLKAGDAICERHADGRVERYEFSEMLALSVSLDEPQFECRITDIKLSVRNMEEVVNVTCSMLREYETRNSPCHICGYGPEDCHCM